MKKISLIFILLIVSFSIIYASDFGGRIETESYEISREVINRELSKGELFRDFIQITNKGFSNIDVVFSFFGEVSEIADLENVSVSVSPDMSEKVYFLIKGEEGEYSGALRISGDINLEIPVNVSVEERDSTSPFLISVEPVKKNFDIGKEIDFYINVKKLKRSEVEGVSFVYTLIGENNESIVLGNEDKNLMNSENILKSFIPPTQVTEGHYYLRVEASYADYSVSDKAPFVLFTPFFSRTLFGVVPMWLAASILSFFILSFLTFYLVKRHIESKKKYKMSVDLKTLPQKSKENLFLGKVAETSHFTYFDPNKLTTHSIIAGATGGGKSITAQVMIEECLKKDIAVIVFDPTAQWSGMLRKCDDKKMISLYPKFGLKPQDATAFKGNVRMIKDARQIIDLEKHMSPGQIEIFSLNKLDPSEMDVFVSSIIRQIFKSDPKEYPGLKVLLVFDEVHRLLPKFGGNGEGFLQIERACREFRKWGIGVMLVSQVLNDFVGEIKANISTEVQMRTRDEGDLNRIKTKHGEEFLQSLVKASAGVGMFANPAYNHAKPYFIGFRPILHNTRRLSDEELEKYNTYNESVDDLEFQIEELEKEKVDTFDLKMELKLVKDKIMSGSFSVVEIYLEGLLPRAQKEWEKIGKKAPKRQIKLLSEAEIQAGIDEAKKKHDDETKKEEKQAAEVKEKTQEVKVKIDEKIVPSLTFDNGVMISSLKELKEYLPGMEESIFNVHVNEEKNDIQKWVSEQFGESEGKKLSGVLEKEEIISLLSKVGVETKKKEEISKEVKVKVTSEEGKKKVKKKEVSKLEGKKKVKTKKNKPEAKAPKKVVKKVKVKNKSS